jgi:hypothetical protein
MRVIHGKFEGMKCTRGVPFSITGNQSHRKPTTADHTVDSLVAVGVTKSAEGRGRVKNKQKNTDLIGLSILYVKFEVATTCC